MRYRYFTFSSGEINKFSKWEFLSESAISDKILKLEEKLHVFQTIQSWDSDGNCFTPAIYADFDGPTALEDARDLVNKIKEVLGGIPEVYFSGKKGFHVIYDREINTTRFSTGIKNAVLKLIPESQSLDKGRYGKRIMFRIPNTRHPVTGLYKIPITTEELNELPLESIKTLATEKRKIIGSIISIDKNKLWELFKEAPRKKERGTKIMARVNLPCVEKLLKSNIKEGMKHYSIVLLASYFRGLQYKEGDVVNILLDNPTLAEHSDHVRNTVESIFNSQEGYNISCMSGSIYAEILKENCSEGCIYEEGDII